MSRIVMFNMITLDGFFEGPNRDINWHHTDSEFNEFAIDQLNTVGGLIFGRVTYQLMESYWPTATAITNDPLVAEKMNSVPKIVFSRTLDRAEWNNTRLVKGEAVDEIPKLKEQPGGDLFIFGSADLASSLTPLGLIDEYRLIVNPVVLGSGAPVFKNQHQQLDLNLIKARPFRNGNVLLYYRPEGST